MKLREYLEEKCQVYWLIKKLTKHCRAQML